MRILYVTRKYPPSTGGMENAAYELYTALAANKENDVTLIKWGGANKLLPLVYPWLLLRSIVAGLQKKPDVIYLQDGLMAPLGMVLRLFVRRPTLITIHGKEATYGNPLYKLIVPPCIVSQDRLVVVSDDTRETVKKAFPGTDPLVIFNGVSDTYYMPDKRDEQLAMVAAAAGMSVDELRQRRLILTVGRFVRRKGVLWFIDTVLPELVKANPSVLYLVAGDGKDREVIEAAIVDRKMGDYVKLLGRTPDNVRAALYNVADIFLMPNIPVANDMEGFGLVALEAASCGTTVVASNLEGIPDAIRDGKNGILVEPGNVEAYIKTIERELKHRSIDPEAVRVYTLAKYAWAGRAQEYEAAMQQLAAKR